MYQTVEETGELVVAEESEWPTFVEALPFRLGGVDRLTAPFQSAREPGQAPGLSM